MADERARKKLLAGGTLLSAMVWEAVRKAAPAGSSEAEALAVIEDRLRLGQAALGIFLERSGDRLYLAVSLVAANQPRPAGTILEARGAIVSSAEELSALTQPPAAPNVH